MGDAGALQHFANQAAPASCTCSPLHTLDTCWEGAGRVFTAPSPRLGRLSVYRKVVPGASWREAKPEATCLEDRPGLKDMGPRPGLARLWVNSDPDSRVHPGPPGLCGLAGRGFSWDHQAFGRGSRVARPQGPSHEPVRACVYLLTCTCTRTCICTQMV